MSLEMSVFGSYWANVGHALIEQLGFLKGCSGSGPQDFWVSRDFGLSGLGRGRVSGFGCKISGFAATMAVPRKPKHRNLALSSQQKILQF